MKAESGLMVDIERVIKDLLRTYSTADLVATGDNVDRGKRALLSPRCQFGVNAASWL